MKQEVYDYLNNYGFDDVEIDEIINENEEIEKANKDNIIKNIEYLESIKLGLDDIINGIVSNVYLLTIRNERLLDIINIYVKELKINDKELFKMFNDNSECFTVSKKKLEDIIDYLTDDIEIDEIKELFVNNSKLLSLSLDEFKRAVNV